MFVANSAKNEDKKIYLTPLSATNDKAIYYLVEQEIDEKSFKTRLRIIF